MRVARQALTALDGPLIERQLSESYDAHCGCRQINSLVSELIRSAYIEPCVLEWLGWEPVVFANRSDVQAVGWCAPGAPDMSDDDDLDDEEQDDGESS